VSHLNRPGGRGCYPGVPQVAPWANLLRLPDFTGMRADYTVAVDWYFAGRGPLAPVDVAYTWISGQVRIREDNPVNAAAVTRTDGATAYASTTTSGDVWEATVNLDTASGHDPANLAQWLVTYYTTRRVRLAQLVFVLNARTPTECWTLLEREVGDRVHIVDTPPSWPRGGTQLVVEGIAHATNGETRVVTWSTSPLVGVTPDVAGPWFRLGVSALGGTDSLAF
jgi:hypothetical protein